MIGKIYTMTWAFIAMAAALFILTGNFTEFTGVVFGFVSFGMIFMGMISVLPATMAHHPEPVKIKKSKTPAKEKVGKGFPATAVHAQ